MHPVELFGEDWLEWAEGRPSPAASCEKVGGGAEKSED